MYNPLARIVICLNNQRFSDAGNGPNSPAHWNQIIMSAWVGLLRARYIIGWAPPRYILQVNVNDNAATMNIINMLISPEDRQHTNYWDFFPSKRNTPYQNDAFYTLLQTPVCVGSAYLCMDYAAFFKGRFVQKITVFWHSDWYFYSLIIQIGSIYDDYQMSAIHDLPVL